MNVFRLYLWREWREHRASLVALFLALPALAALITQGLSRRTLADPWVTCALALSFVLIVLVAVGAELLGGERRGSGLSWLERLPGGLGSAFGAKLTLLVASTVAAAGCGFATARLIALVRGATPVGWVSELTHTLSFALVLAAWAFACSTWTLRGGVAFLAAALVLALIGYPARRVLAEGYDPSGVELTIAAALLACGGLFSAGLAFLWGSKRGRGTGWTALFGLAPAIPLLGVSLGWSSDRFRLRQRFDPHADDFGIAQSWVADDAQHAIVLAGHEDARWNEHMPLHVLAVDLESGAWTEAARSYVGHELVTERTDDGTAREAQLVIWVAESESALLFDLSDGTRMTSRKKSKVEWELMGRGQWIKEPLKAEVVHDPFRGRDYPCRAIPFWESYWETVIFVRPGRWLCQEDPYASWFLYDPDSHAREPLPFEVYDVLGLLPDGRMLLDSDKGTACFDPDTEALLSVDVGERSLRSTGNSRVFQAFGERYDWCVLDPETLQARILPWSGDYESFVSALSDEQALLHLRRPAQLVALDLTTGVRTTVFPRLPSN